jgi:hypothetical protein
LTVSSVATVADHSCAHSGHANIWPSSYVYSHEHFGHGGNVVTSHSTPLAIA